MQCWTNLLQLHSSYQVVMIFDLGHERRVEYQGVDGSGESDKNDMMATDWINPQNMTILCSAAAGLAPKKLVLSHHLHSV